MPCRGLEPPLATCGDRHEPLLSAAGHERIAVHPPELAPTRRAAPRPEGALGIAVPGHLSSADEGDPDRVALFRSRPRRSPPTDINMKPPRPLPREKGSAGSGGLRAPAPLHAGHGSRVEGRESGADNRTRTYARSSAEERCRAKAEAAGSIPAGRTRCGPERAGYQDPEEARRAPGDPVAPPRPQPHLTSRAGGG